MRNSGQLLVLLAAATMACCFAVSASGQQMRITPDTVFKDHTGAEIEREEFRDRLQTGRYRPVPIHDDEGELIGYRLNPREGELPAKGGPGAGRVQQIAIDSTPIGGPVTIELIRFNYLFIPLEVFNGEEWASHLFIFDTGTFIPIIMLEELRGEFGTIETARVAGLEFERPTQGKSEHIDRMIHRMNDRYSQESPEIFGDRPIAGVVGINMFSNYLVSVDAREGLITLRPMDSEQRTLFDADPVAKTAYRGDQHNIWFPVSVNGHEGYAHLDTGNPQFHIDSRVAEGGDGEVFRSFVVGGMNLAPCYEREGAASPNPRPLGGRYPFDTFEVIAAVGNHGIEPFVVTVDRREQTLYFERRPGK